MVIVDRAHYEELLTASDDDLHFLNAALEDFDFRHVYRANILRGAHVHVIRVNLRKNIQAVTPEIADETIFAIEDEFGALATSEWTPVVAFEKVCALVARQIHRVFVGFPFCI
jgi:hypothetical protein